MIGDLAPPLSEQSKLAEATTCAACPNRRSLPYGMGGPAHRHPDNKIVADEEYRTSRISAYLA